MDGIRFDRLARLLVSRATRRQGLAVPLALAASGGAFAAQVAGERCLRDGRRCGRTRGGKNKARRGAPCRSCCSGYARRNRCACRGEGVACRLPGQCCSGECVDEKCSATCIGLTDPCSPESDICCRSGAVCQDTPRTDGPICCLPGGFPCDDALACCNGSCDHGTRRCASPATG